ncbi:MAG: epimerase, partial [Sciscionella sp.]
VATISYPWVAEALRVLRAGAGHWTFVSSISVYNDISTLNQRPDAPVLAPKRLAGDAETGVDPDLYGAVKVASEDAVREAMGERAFVVRPGLITGPGDMTDRFGYWPARMSGGGRVVVPDTPELQAQYVDVRDLAAWIVEAGERRLTGTYDGVGPSQPLPELLAEVAKGFDVELAPVSGHALTAAAVRPWAGRRSLPLWLPDTHLGMCAHDAEPALRAGLRPRPLADAVSAALQHERALGLAREREAGLTAAEESEVLAGLH